MRAAVRRLAPSAAVDVPADPRDLYAACYGRLVQVLTLVAGSRAEAEDVVQEAFCRALEIWPFRGIPENPSAWLVTTAKNCAHHR